MASEAVNVEGGDEVTRTFLHFLNSFAADDAEHPGGGSLVEENGSSRRVYVEQLESMYDRNGTTLYVDFQHLAG